MDDRTATAVIRVVTAIWAVNVIFGMFEVGGYKPSESINAVFTGIVGGAFAVRAYATNKNGGPKDKDDAP